MKRLVPPSETTDGDGEMRWQQRKSAMTRESILKAATECLVELGYSGLTTIEVTKRAAISRGAMHHHFANRTELVAALIDFVLHRRLEFFLGEYLASLRDAEPSEAIRLATSHIDRAVAEPDDLEARGAMLLAATWAGVGIDNAGTGMAHNIAHALASLVPIHHGRAVAIGMSASLGWSMEGHEKDWSEVARAFGCAHYGELPMAFSGLVRRLGIRLSRAADTNRIPPERLAAQMAAAQNAPMRAASRREVTDEDLLLLAERTLGFS